MTGAVARLNAALLDRYTIERDLGEGAGAGHIPLARQSTEA